MAGIDLVTSKADMSSPPLTDHRSKACSAFLVAAHLMDKLGPLLVSQAHWCSLLVWSVHSFVFSVHVQSFCFALMVRWD